MNKLQWFKFVISDWGMGKIQRCPEITQLRFIRLCCLYWNKECELSVDDAEIEIDKEHLDILISKKVVKIKDDYIIINFLLEQMFDIEETSQKRRKSVIKRWEKAKQNYTSVLQSDTSVLQSDTEESREEESRLDEIEEEEEIIKEKKFNFKKALIEYGFEEELIKEWLLIRKSKKGINSELAFKNFITEIELAPEDKNDIMRFIIKKQWRGFEYQWLLKEQSEFKKIVQPQQKMYGRLTEETMRKNGDMTGVVNPFVVENK